jgi:hypothetical protein
MSHSISYAPSAFWFGCTAQRLLALPPWHVACAHVTCIGSNAADQYSWESTFSCTMKTASKLDVQSLESLPQSQCAIGGILSFTMSTIAIANF